MFKQRRRYNKTPSRRKIPGVGAESNRARRREIQIVSIVVDGTAVIVVTFDSPTMYTGIFDKPGWSIEDTVSVVSVEMVDDLHAEITMSATVEADSPGLQVPFEDPTFRNNCGGYVRPGLYAVTE